MAVSTCSTAEPVRPVADILMVVEAYYISHLDHTDLLVNSSMIVGSNLHEMLVTWKGQTAVKLSGAEATDRAQCAAPDKPIGYWNLLVVFADLKRVIQCACLKSLGSRKGTPKCILAVVQHLPRKWPVSSSSMQRGHNESLTLRIIVRCRLRVLCPVRRYTSILRSRRHCRKANCVSPGVTWVTSSLACDMGTSHQFYAFSSFLFWKFWQACDRWMEGLTEWWDAVHNAVF